MNAEQIADEYRQTGRISGKAMSSLRKMIRDGEDPFSVITLAGDVAAFQLADDIARHLDSEDGMVRWNAAGVLFTRFRDVRLAQHCIGLLDRESDTMVRGISLVGAGELLPLVEDEILQQELATRLWQALEDEDELPEIRSAAYAGLEAAVGLSLAERSRADVILSREEFRQPVIDEFRAKYSI